MWHCQWHHPIFIAEEKASNFFIRPRSIPIMAAMRVRWPDTGQSEWQITVEEEKQGSLEEI